MAISSAHPRSLATSPRRLSWKALPSNFTPWSVHLTTPSLPKTSTDKSAAGTMRRLFPEDRTEEETFILGKILAGEKVDHFETVRIRKDGKQIHVSVTISA